MPARRGRACDSCHAIKIKCELGSAGGGQPPCQRCLRLGKTCLIYTPMRQKDRIAELEARLEEMTKLMQLQQIYAPSTEHVAGHLSGRQNTTSTEIRESRRLSKKRKFTRSAIVGRSDSGGSSSDYDNNEPVIDRLVSRTVQSQLLSKYRSEIEPVFPFPVNKPIETLREENPILLHAVILAVSPGVLSSEIQDELSSSLMKLLAPEEITKAKKSIDLVQAILLASFWYRTPRKQVHFGIDRFVTLIISIAEEIGISKSDCALSATSTNADDQPGSSDAWRTWNLCFLLSSSLACCTRTPPKILWDADIEMKLSALEYGRDSLSTDALLCQFVRAGNLCQQVIKEAGYNELDKSKILEITDYARVRRLRNLIIDRKAQVFSSVSCPSLKIYEHAAVIFLHECILYTPTNSRSFAAPYVADRLSLTDFPAPAVTQDHISFLDNLRDACHAVLDIFITLDLEILASLPLVIFVSKVLYAQWILVKMHIALTASGNTYGAYFDVQTLQLDKYLEQVAGVGDDVCAFDPTSLTGRGLQSAKKLREWVWNCRLLQNEESNLVLSPSNFADLGHEDTVLESIDSDNWIAFDSQIDVSLYNLESLFNDSTN